MQFTYLLKLITTRTGDVLMIKLFDSHIYIYTIGLLIIIGTIIIRTAIVSLLDFICINFFYYVLSLCSTKFLYINKIKLLTTPVVHLINNNLLLLQKKFFNLRLKKWRAGGVVQWQNSRLLIYSLSVRIRPPSLSQKLFQKSRLSRPN